MKRPIIDEDGKANHVLGVATDITERKRVEEEGSCGARLFTDQPAAGL